MPIVFARPVAAARLPARPLALRQSAPARLASLVLCAALAAAAAPARAADPEPLDVPPPIEEPAERAPHAKEPPAAPDEDAPEKKRPRKPRKAKKLPDGTEVGLGGPIFVGSSVGCLAGAPAFGTAAAGGLLLLLAGPTGAGAGGLGLVLASMGLIGLGPCAVGGTGCGTAAGSVFGERELMPAVWGLLPGAVLAVGSTGTALAGAAVSATDANLGNILLVTSVVSGALAGPVAVLGATLTDAVWGDADPLMDDDDAKSAASPGSPGHVRGISLRAAPMAY